MNIALLSPNENVYSETFIQAHKERLRGNVFFYYAGVLPTKLKGGLIINSRRKRIIDIFKGHFKLNRFTLVEQALITSFLKKKIDLVFAEYGHTAQRVLSICKELNLPLITHFHGYDASHYQEIKINNSYREVFNYSSFVIVVSRKMEGDLLAMGCPKEKLIYSVCGPREDFLAVNPQFTKQQFVSIGRFVDKKAPYYLILSFLEVVKNYPKATLVMAGDGKLWNSCKNLVNFYNLSENIFFPGIVSGEIYREYLSKSLAMVQHSITAEDGDAEGTPVSILEASAAGVPVISTRHAGIPDVIVEEKTGMLIEEHDVEGMTEKMLILLANPILAKELGRNGKANIKNNFTLDKHINILDGLISRAVKTGRKGLKK